MARPCVAALRAHPLRRHWLLGNILYFQNEHYVGIPISSVAEALQLVI